MVIWYYSKQFINYFRGNNNHQDLLPYFSLGCCMEGLNNLFRCLYDVTLQHVETHPGEVWSYDVHKVVSFIIVLKKSYLSWVVISVYQIISCYVVIVSPTVKKTCN